MQVYRGSFAYFMSGSIAEGNGITGVLVAGSSSMFIGDVIIRNNGSAGIAIGNASSVDIESYDGTVATQISGNGTNVDWGTSQAYTDEATIDFGTVDAKPPGDLNTLGNINPQP